MTTERMLQLNILLSFFDNVQTIDDKYNKEIIENKFFELSKEFFISLGCILKEDEEN